MTETNDIKVARLEVQMTDTKVQLGRVETKLDSVITKLDAMTTLQIEIADLRRELIDIKGQVAINLKKDALTKWVYPTAAAFAGAVLAILVNIAIVKK